MKEKMKQFFYRSRRRLAAALCVLLCIQAVEPLGATISNLGEKDGNHISLLDAPGVDSEVFESMDLYIEQRGDIFALDLKFAVAANMEQQETASEEETTSGEESSEVSSVEGTTGESATEEVSASEVTSEADTQEPAEPNPSDASSDETSSDEASSDGASSDGASSDGASSDGASSDGASSDGASSDGGASDGASSDASASGEEPAGTKSTAGEKSSADLEVEKIVREMEANYAVADKQEMKLLEASKEEIPETEVLGTEVLGTEKTGTEEAAESEADPDMEELQFTVDFTEAFYLLEAAGDKNVLNEEGKPIGSFELSEEGRLTLTVSFDTPKYREATMDGSLHFSLGNTGGEEGELRLLWDEEAQAVDVEVEKSWLGSLLERFSLWDMKGAKTGAPVIPETSKTIELDLMTNLPSEVTRMYESLTLKMSVPRAERGGTQITPISVRIDAKMKNTYLAGELGSVEDAILEWLDQPGNADKGIDGWLKDVANADKLTPMEFTIDFADTTTPENAALSFAVIEGENKSDIMIGDVEYGTCTLMRNDPDKKVTLTCKLSNRLYGMKNVTFGANFSLNADKELKEREVPVFQMSGGKITCKGTELHFLESEPSDTKPYSLTKKLTENRAENAYVTFELAADSYVSLAGTAIVDELPPELQLESLSLKLDDGSKRILEEREYTYQNRKIIYRFPADAAAKKAVLTVEAMLTPETVFAMTNAGTEAGQTAKFENKAYMEDSGGNKLNGTDTSDEGEKKFQMFQKTGKQNENDGTLLDWTIDIDVSFHGSIDMYLLDSLDPGSHEYIDGGTLTVESGTMSNGTFTPESTNEIDLDKVLTTAANRDYKTVTADTLNTITGKDRTKAFYYSAKTGQDVMALNLGNFVGTNGTHLRVKYSTRIAGLNNQAGAYGTKNFRNFADLRWKTLHWGNGPYAGSADLNYNINKPVEAKVNIATKRAGAYDVNKQVQTWYFDVNYYGMAYTDLVITEDLTDSPDQRIPDPPNPDSADWKLEISKVHKGGFAEIQIPLGTTGSTAPYYTKTAQKLEIHLGDVSAADYFTVAFNTKVGGKAVIGNNKEYTLENSATITTGSGASLVETAASDSKKIENILLEKEALKPNKSVSNGTVNGYDTRTGELHWRIFINPKSLQIKGGEITDTLPVVELNGGERDQGEFGRITKVTYGTGTEEKQTVNNDVTDLTGETGQDKVRIGDSPVWITIDKTTDPAKTVFSITGSASQPITIDQPLTIEFTTKLDADVLSKLHEDDRSEKTGTEGIFVEDYQNVACLDGMIVNPVDDSESDISPETAKDDASHHVAIQELSKSGKYGGADGKTMGAILWSANINEAHSSIGGLTLGDILPAKVEYRKGSLKLYEITGFKEDGSIDAKTEIADATLTSTYGFTEMLDDPATKNTKGFTLTFPVGDTKAYYMEFLTFIAEDAKPGEIKNQFTLSEGAGEVLKSNQADSGLEQEFFADDYATGTKIPLLVLEKVSSSKDEYGKHQIKFKDVHFNIFQTERGSTNWGSETEVKTKITNEKGRKLFLDVAQGNIYRIEEDIKTVPKGYSKMLDKYVYFKTEADKGKVAGTPAKTEAELLDYIKETGGVPSSTDRKDIYLVDTLYKRLVLENTPDADSEGGKVQFVKHNELRAPIVGVRYRLKHSKGWVAAQEVDSDQHGIVTFANVDPIESSSEVYYELTEVSTVSPYSLDPTDYRVEKNGTDGTYTITDAEGNALPKVSVSTLPAPEPPASETTYFEIQNKLALANLEITKQDSVTKAALKDAVYTLSGLDAIGREISTVLPGPFTTNASGKVTIPGIPVSGADGYVLTETVYPGGYQQSSSQKITYKVTVTPKVTIVKVDKGYEYKKCTAEIKVENIPSDSDNPSNALPITPVTAEGTVKVTLLNTPVIGKITFTKQGNIRGTKTPLGGVRFGLFTDLLCNKPAKDSTGGELEAVSSTDSGSVGQVTFDDVYFGTYYLKELPSAERPKGYMISTEIVKVAVTAGPLGALGDIIETTGPTTTYTFLKAVGGEGEGELTNSIASAQMKLKKTNQNGDLLPGVKFSIERYGDAGSAVPSGTDWTPYPVTGNSSPDSHIVAADAAGMVDFKDLIYGTYRITETKIPPEYELVVNSEPFYIKVGIVTDIATGAQSIQAVTYDTEPTDKTPDLIGGTVMTPDTAGQAEYTQPIVNELKYGLIQLSKVAATKSVTEGTITYAISATGSNANTIGEAYFEIYQGTDVNPGSSRTAPALKTGAKPYVTLKTDANGQLPYLSESSDPDRYAYEDVYSQAGDGKQKGDKTGKKVKLLLGTYYIKEIDAPPGYVIDNDLHEFKLESEHYESIKPSDAPITPRYQWISNTKGAKVQLNGTETADPYFVNEIVRATVSLDKVKKDKGIITASEKLKDAVFIIYTDEAEPKAVASLKWDDTAGKYLLSDENPPEASVSFTMNNDQGIPFVVQNTQSGIYQLVSGKYFVDEAVVPKGYGGQKDDSADGFQGRRKYPFTLDSEVDVVIGNEPANAALFTNTLGRGVVTVQKRIDLDHARAESVTDAQKNPDGFQFTLTKKETDSGVDYQAVTIGTTGGSASAPAAAVFDGVPYGTYTLTEVAGTKDGYQMMEPLELQVSQSGVVITTNLTDREDAVFNNTNQTIEVTNVLIQADIMGTKMGSAGTDYGDARVKLPGAVFALYRDAACQTLVCEADAPTDRDGKFTFRRIAYGTYYLKEKTAPAGYSASTETIEVKVVQSGQNVTVSESQFTNTVQKSSLELKKTDATTGQPVSHAVFSVYGKDAKGTGKDKVVAYLVESQTAPGTYILSNRSGIDTVAVYTNAEGLERLLYNSADSNYYLTAGAYYYKETTTPQYYQKKQDPVDVTVAGTALGDQQTLQAVNTRELTDVTFQKVDQNNGIADASGNKVPYGIAGITFTLYGDAGCIQMLQTAVSTGDAAADQENGSVTFCGLLPGVYFFKETAVPEMDAAPMYVLRSEVYTFTVDEDVSDGVTTPEITLVTGAGEVFGQIENTANSDLEVSLTMNLKSTAGNPLANANFRLFRNGVFYATVKTDANGIVDFGKVLPATYTLVQDTSTGNHIPISQPIEQEVKNPAVTGIFTYHIPVVNDKPKEEEVSKDSGGKKKGDSTSSSTEEKKDEVPKQPELETPAVPDRIVPEVIPADMVLDQDIQEIKQFFETLEEGSLTAEDSARKEAWHKEFQKNGEHWREKFGMTPQEWTEWMAAAFRSDYQTLPKTGGMMVSMALALIGIGFIGYGAYETFGKGNKKCFKKKKK